LAGVVVALLIINQRIRSELITRTSLLSKENREKQLALERAEESDRLKSAFLNNLSHEIRTPMNGIMGFSTMLRNGRLSASQVAQYTGIIDSSAGQLLQIVDDVLDMAHLDSGLARVNPHLVKPRYIIETLYERFRADAEDKGIVLSMEVPESDQGDLYTDRTKLRQILANLLNNALKYTGKGKITFGYRHEGNDVLFFVRDTGIGIPQKAHRRIFDRFYKVDSSDSQMYGGSGLGLPISRGFVNLLGGTIWLESEPGRGSSFYFTIPGDLKTKEQNKTVSDNEPVEASRFDFNGVTILVAEDDELNQFFISEIFQPTGARLIMASDGKEAIDYLDNNRDIKIAFLDIKMPGMDGLEAAGRIREKNRDIMLVALTAYSQHHEKEIALNAGFDRFVSKPVKKEELFKFVENAIS
jgi:CheY-like chemotaxis protein